MAEPLHDSDIADVVAPAQGCVLCLTRGAVQTCGLLMRLARQMGREGVPVVVVAGTVEPHDSWDREDNVTLINLSSSGTLRRNLARAHRWIEARRHFDAVVQEVAWQARARGVLFENPEAAGLAMRLEALMPDRPLVYLASELSCAGTPWPYRRQERRAAGRLTGIIMNEPHRLAIWYRDAGRRIPGIVIPNTVCLSEAPSGDDGEGELLDACRTHGRQPTSLLLVYHGLLEPQRCLRQMLEAIAMSPPGVSMAIIGAAGSNGGYPAGEVRELIAVLGLQERVRILPFVPRHRLLELVRHADVGMLLYQDVNLNYYFCAPNKLYEYAACGLPMIGPAWLGIAELFRRHGLGLTVVPDNVEQIATAIDTMRDPDVRAAYSKSATRSFREELCFERYWEREGPTLLQWLRVY